MRSPRPLLIRLPVAAVLLALILGAGRALPDLHVTGTVMDAATGRPLAGAQVFVPGTATGALTDGQGRYVLTVPEEMLSGQPRLRVVLLGYAPEDRPIPAGRAHAGDTVRLDVRLRAQTTSLDEIVTLGDPRADQARTVEALARPATPVAQSGNGGVIASAPVVGNGYAYPPGRPHPGWDREQYDHIEENGFRAVADHPLSTFSIDVDRASYSNVRRFLLREGRVPPVDAVQIEEMVNYFAYDYRRPDGRHPVAVTAEVGRAPWAPEHRLLRVGLASRPVATEDLPPANLVFLLDVSGSMSSPDKLPLVQASMRLLVEQMRPQDRVAIVVYAGAAGLVLPPTSGAHRETILHAVERLHAGGSTAGGAGLRLAYDVARHHFRPEGNNRVILATDGDFNVGESSDGAMIRLIEERREEGTFLTVLGFGTGNLQSAKMQGLAQHGNGTYAYIDGMAEARKVLVGEMGGTLLTVAKDVKVQVEFNPGRVAAYRLLGYENRLLASEDFNDDAKDAGEMGAGHTVTALFEIIPPGVSSPHLPPRVDPLRYGAGEPGSGEAREAHGAAGDEIAFVKVRYKAPEGGPSRLLTHPVSARAGRGSSDFRFAAAVAGFGMLLRESEYRGELTVDEVRALARDGLGDDPGGYRHGFLELVDRYAALVHGHGWEPTGW